ncbi:MAG: hypothetical protein PHR27_09485 [Candidatus Cloacimonetes bacterium]|nr:hypothetical protein [Candidatus Cloacimonadota bacterium]
MATKAKKIDISKLEEGLEQLTGFDFKAAEKTARSNGENIPEIALSKSFQALLAAKALGVGVLAIEDMPIADFAKATTKVFNFLYKDLGKNPPADSTESQE